MNIGRRTQNLQQNIYYIDSDGKTISKMLDKLARTLFGIYFYITE